MQRRYERVIELDSENAGARLGYGLLLFQMKQPDKAIPQIEYALKNSYSRAFTYVLLAFAYEQTGDLAARRADAGRMPGFIPAISLRAASPTPRYCGSKARSNRRGEQQKIIYDLHGYDALSWELPIKMKSR